MMKNVNDDDTTIMTGRHEPGLIDLRGSVAGPTLAFLVMVLIALVMPSSFLLYSPGPADDVTALVDGQHIVEIDGAQTYPTDTDLYMTTVSSRGTPQAGASGLEVVYAAVSKNIRSQPVRAVYEAEQTQEQVREESVEMMTSSQEIASAVAQEQAGLDVAMTLTVAGFSPGSHAEGILEIEDQIVRIQDSGADVVEARTFRDLTSVLENTDPGSTVTLTVLRDGKELNLDVKTRAYEPDVNGWVNPGSLLGVLIGVTGLDAPASADFLIDGIGGPSAGSVFAASIYDSLTPGSLGGDAKIAGTGELSWDGRVNAIGGIRHKLVGAARAGATDFFAPATNCQDTVGFVPDGMNVWAVRDFDDVIDVIESVGAGDTGGLVSCADVAAQVPADYQLYR